MFFIRNNKVIHNIEHKCYSIIDEYNKPHQVTILPKSKCSCSYGKANCCHILAVQHINGLYITDAYKAPNMGEVFKSKRNGKLTGRKKRGHKANSKAINVIAQAQAIETNDLSSESDEIEAQPKIEIRNIIIKESIDHKPFILELLLNDYHEIIISYLEKKKLFETKMIVSDTQSLSDFFIINNFDISSLKEYFNKEAWSKVLTCYKNKIRLSKCGVCLSLCLDNFIECTDCNKWYHWSCAKVSLYHQSGRSIVINGIIGHVLK